MLITKNNLMLAICILLMANQGFASPTSLPTANTSPLNRNEANRLIAKNIKAIIGTLATKQIKSDQSFRIEIPTDIFFIVSAIRNDSSNDDLRTCSMLLFDHTGNIRSAIDTVGQENEIRPWYCDYVEAMSFKDRYPDGSLQVIALYLATPPSSERFTLPVIMKLDVTKPSLSIDEALTKELEDKNIKHIKDARRLLQKYR